MFARLGGDEFGVILAGTTAERAGAVADEFLDAIRADTSIQLEGNVVRLTASIGLTSIDPAGDATAEDIVRQADIAMYEAKESGAIAGSRARVQRAASRRRSRGWGGRTGFVMRCARTASCCISSRSCV